MCSDDSQAFIALLKAKAIADAETGPLAMLSLDELGERCLNLQGAAKVRIEEAGAAVGGACFLTTELPALLLRRRRRRRRRCAETGLCTHRFLPMTIRTVH